MAKYKVTTDNGTYMVTTQDDGENVSRGTPQQDSVATQGIDYVRQHPFKSTFEPVTKTITGKTVANVVDDSGLAMKNLQANTKFYGNNPISRIKSVAENTMLDTGAQLADMAQTPGTYLAGPALKLGGKIASKAGQVIPKTIKTAAAGIHNSIVKLPNKAFRFSKDPLDVLNKEGITANTTTDYANIAKQKLTERSQQLENAIQNSTQRIDADSIISQHLDEAANKSTGSLKDRSAGIKELEFMRDSIIKKYGNLQDLSVQDAIKLKRQLADDFPFVMEDPNNINTKAAHKIYHDLNKAVEAAHPEIKELNHRVSGLIDISHAATNRAAVESRNPFTNFDKFIGLGGLLSGNPVAGAAIVGAKKVLGSPAVQTRVANAAYKVAGGKTKIPVAIATAGAGSLAVGSSNSEASERIDIKKINKIESDNNPKAIGDNGKAFGINQIHLPTLGDFNKSNKKSYTQKDLMDETKNNEVAEWYYNKEAPRLLKSAKIPDTVENRIRVYNQGIGNMKKGRKIPKVTSDYIKKYKGKK